MNKGKVEVVTATGNEWTTPNAPGKTFYDFDYQIDGIKFVASHVTPEPKYSVGTEVWFTITKDNGQYPDKIKFEQAPEGEGTPQQAGKPAFKKSGSFDNFDTMIMSYAKDLAVARINNGGYKTVTADKIVKDFITLKEGLEVVKMAEPVVEEKTATQMDFKPPLASELLPPETPGEDLPDWMK